MRPMIIIFTVAALLLGGLAYAVFHMSAGLAPLPGAARGAVLAAILGAAGLFAFFLFLQRRQRQRDRDDPSDTP